MTQYLHLTVAEWGGRWARPPVAEKLPDGECAVHHVGGGAWMGGTVQKGYAASRAAAIKVFFNLNEYAINTKRYSFLDYDILVWYDRFNDISWIGEGRGQWLSAATRGRNELAEAIVLCGNTQLRDPLPEEIEGLARGIVHGIEKGWMTRGTWIYGHRDNPAHPYATTCPGDSLYVKLPVIRFRVVEILNPPAPSPGSYIVPDIQVPREIIKSAPPVADGNPSDPLWFWATLYQQHIIPAPGTLGPAATNLYRIIQWGINNAIDEGTIPGPKVPETGKYDQATGEGWSRWLNR